MCSAITLRHELFPSDREAIGRIIRSSNLFYEYEVGVALELVDERLAKGPASGYHFIFAEEPGRVLGYTCYGPIACTKWSFDLFWIAVLQELRGKGIGRMLLAETEKAVRTMEGKRIYIETSSRHDYRLTQDFYRTCGYAIESVLKEFYGPADDKMIFVKELPFP